MHSLKNADWCYDQQKSLGYNRSKNLPPAGINRVLKSMLTNITITLSVKTPVFFFIIEIWFDFISLHIHSFPGNERAIPKESFVRLWQKGHRKYLKSMQGTEKNNINKRCKRQKPLPIPIFTLSSQAGNSN